VEGAETDGWVVGKDAPVRTDRKVGWGEGSSQDGFAIADGLAAHAHPGFLDYGVEERGGESEQDQTIQCFERAHELPMWFEAAAGVTKGGHGV